MSKVIFSLKEDNKLFLPAFRMRLIAFRKMGSGDGLKAARIYVDDMFMGKNITDKIEIEIGTDDVEWIEELVHEYNLNKEYDYIIPNYSA